MWNRRRLCDLLPVLALAWLLLTVLGIWGGRLGYAFDLEWMEGGMLAHAWRIREGLPLYAAPSPEFVPFVYPPGYSVLLAAVGAVVGLDYLPGRLLSVLGVVAAASAVGAMVYRRPERDGVVAACAAGAFVSCYAFSGAFYDLVRPDGLSLGLLAWAVVAAGSRRPVWSGLLLAAAFWCKHSAALYGVPLVLGLWARDGVRPALRFAVASVLPALALTIAAQVSSGGHFLRYLLLVPGSHGLVGVRVWPLTPSELGVALPFFLAVIAASVLLVEPRRLPVPLSVIVPVGAASVGAGLALAWGATAPSALIGHAALVAALVGVLVHAVDHVMTRTRPAGDTVLVVGLGVTALVSAMLMRGHQGGFVNVHMPAHWMICAGGGVALSRWRAADRRLPTLVVSGGLLALQLLWGRSAIVAADLVPTTEDRLAGEALVAELKVRRGPILSPYSAWLPVRAGHPPSLHMIGVMDIDHAGGPYVGHLTTLTSAIEEGMYGAVLQGNRPIGYGVSARYRPERMLFDEESSPPEGRPAFMPRSGWQVRPQVLMVPR